MSNDPAITAICDQIHSQLNKYIEERRNPLSSYDRGVAVGNIQAYTDILSELPTALKAVGFR